MQSLSIRLTWLLAATTLTLTLTGCYVIDPASTTFACRDGGVCDVGFACCGDNQCRTNCNAATSDAGPSRTDAGFTTPDGGPACDPTTCASGCCDGDTCVTGNTPALCGRGGFACQRCTGQGETCTANGVCSGCAATCTTGCCVGSTCTQRASSTCGGNGQACNGCGPGADSCSATGQCACGTGAACALGQRCSLGQCVCDANSCPNGCCTAAGQCVRVAAQNSSICGLGSACAACESPPLPVCLNGSTRIAFTSPGSCERGACTYRTNEQACTSGCSQGDCVGDVCRGCLTPPAATCDGTVRLSYVSPGTCSATGCSYASQEQTCPFGCGGGACNPDPCAGRTCTSPTPPTCEGNTRVSFRSPGSCSGNGSCSYTRETTVCANGCNAATGNCIDPCATANCNAPPAATCVGSVRYSFMSPGTCDGSSGVAVCSYPQNPPQTCPSGCSAGACNGDPCGGFSCSTPAPAFCVGNVRHTYAVTGTCSAASGMPVCSYPENPPQTCANGCSNGSCNGDPCINVQCNSPSPAFCVGNVRRSYQSTGTCSSTTGSAVCSYAENTPQTCANGCTGGVCNGDPCINFACNSPSPPYCVGNVRRTYAPIGTCSSATGSPVCSYSENTPQTCQFGCSGGACNADPCVNQTCNSPGAPFCVGNVRHTYASSGTCSSASGAAVCGYNENPPQTCPNGCSGGACNSDPCGGQQCSTPGAPYCVGTVRHSYASSGTCSSATGSPVCSYPENPPQTCPNGCSGGACNGDPCLGQQCNSPNGPYCVGNVRHSYVSTGTCSAATGSPVCSYAENPPQTCQFGCGGGACNGDPCLNQQCNTPSAPYCVGNVRHTYSSSGTCSSATGVAVCSYSENTPETCTNGCSNGSCNGDPCVGYTCNTPGAPFCVGNVRRVYLPNGMCSSGTGSPVCSYTEGTPQTCTYGCSGGSCNADPCIGYTCNTPGSPYCVGNVRHTYASPGTCTAAGTTASCSYAENTPVTCPYGCTVAGCAPDPCISQSCTTPPPTGCEGNSRKVYNATGTCSSSTGAAVCGYSFVLNPCNTPNATTCSGGTLTTYSPAGTCSGQGVCSYAANPTTCPFGCNAAGTACAADPCASVTCTQPPNACVSTIRRKVYTSAGTCSSGSCSTAPSYEEDCPGRATECVGNTLTSYSAQGTCSGAGSCSNSVSGTVDCTTPQPSVCTGLSSYTVYSNFRCGSASCLFDENNFSCGTNYRCQPGGSQGVSCVYCGSLGCGAEP